MDTFYLVVYIVVLILNIIFPLYLLGRMWFALSPFVINLYFSEKKSWYNDWNSTRFIIVFTLFVISFGISFLWGLPLLEKIKFGDIDITSIFFYIFLQSLCFVLLEGKMDHSFKPYAAYKKFHKEKYAERFVFTKKIGTKETILLQSKKITEEIKNSKQSLSEEILQHKNVSEEIHHLATENNQLLKTSDFNFEIRNTANLILADVMEDYFISKDSEENLSNFLLRKRKSGKIIFTKTARNGVSVQPILDFFSKYTDLIEKCKNEEINEEKITTQVEAIKIINEIVLANDKHGNPVEIPINSKNFSKYLS
ncbi:hypothetical protein [Chryseobacterium koreense]|uniref:hypothetical protein n=1 Tax=Chryseobacterium koreense TaxID=232216 RepID=UPI000A7E6F7B|nr:hypothetical protein [Chryseobacterium koreense]MBB5333725.1 hypothetical protein [Chryseobacterium koreense]